MYAADHALPQCLEKVSFGRSIVLEKVPYSSFRNYNYNLLFCASFPQAFETMILEYDCGLVLSGRESL